MTIDDSGENIGEIAKRLDVIELCGLDKRGDDPPVFGPGIGACKQRVLAIEGNRPDGSLDSVGAISIRPSSINLVNPSQRDRA